MGVIEDILTNGPTVKNMIVSMGPVSVAILFNWMTGEIIKAAVGTGPKKG